MELPEARELRFRKNSNVFGRGICKAKVGKADYFKFQSPSSIDVYRATGKRFLIQRYFRDLDDARAFGAEWFAANGYPVSYYASLLGAM